MTNDFADDLRRETLEDRRQRHARELVTTDGIHEGGTTSIAELAACRFAAVTLFEGDSGVHSVGNTEADVCEFVAGTRERELPVFLDRIVDLDTGYVYATGAFVKVVSVTFNGTTYAFEHEV